MFGVQGLACRLKTAHAAVPCFELHPGASTKPSCLNMSVQGLVVPPSKALCAATLHPRTLVVVDYACHVLCMHASASMGAQGRPSKTPHQVLPRSLSSKTPATAGKPPSGKGFAAAAVSKTPHPKSATRDAVSKGQLTNKLEKSSSTPLVEVVTGD